MKYIKEFLRFWRKFIVGDDSRIAVVVMWALIFAKSLTSNFIGTVNGWMVIPAIVVILLLVVVLSAVTERTRTLQKGVILVLAAVLPMIIVTSLPLLLFRYMNGTVDLRYTWLPVAFYIVVASILLVGSYKIFQRFPLFTIFVYGLLSILMVTVWQDSIMRQLYHLNDLYPVIMAILAGIVPSVLVAGCGYCIFRLNRVRPS